MGVYALVRQSLSETGIQQLIIVQCMSFRIINNNDENHFSEVKRLFAESDEIVIVSPFLSEEVMNSLGKYLPDKVKNITLVTTLKPFDAEQFKKVKALAALYQLKKMRGFNLSILIDNELHGKVYIGKKNGKYVGCIVSSANFTNKGLVHNHEWGVFMDNQKEITKMHEHILLDATLAVSNADIQKMIQYIEEHPEEDVKRPVIDANFVGMLKPVLASKGKFVTYWIKPLGTSEEPVPEDVLFNKSEMNITFARFPRSVMTDDVLIAYSVRTQRMLSVFTAMEERGPVRFFRREKDKQWPWYAKCKNITSKYGANWVNIDLTLRELRKSYLREYPNGLVSLKSQNLDALMHGHDHIRLDANFAEFVIKKMVERN